MIKELNYADSHILAGSIEVIGALSSSNIRQLESNVEAMQGIQSSFQTRQEDYWSELSDDGVITPLEKNFLKREFAEIERSYAALLTQASAQNLQNEPYFLNYTSVYNTFKSYLYEDLKLFDDMEATTEIDDRETFNSRFSNYYYFEKLTVISLNTGIMSRLGFRTLESLEETGTEGEIALYKGTIYQWVTDHWEAVGLEGYVGTQTSLPPSGLNQYFMAAENFNVDHELIINEQELEINNEILYVTQTYELGFIYVSDGTYWRKLTDKTDYRYVVAMVDLVSLTGELPGAFQTAIDDAVDKAKQDLRDYTDRSLAREIADRQGQYTIIAGDIVRIDDDILDIIDTAEKQQKSIDSHTSSITVINGEITSIGTDISTINGNISTINGNITNINTSLNTKISHLPVNLGSFNYFPADGMKDGDYFFHTTKLRVYLWTWVNNKYDWKELSPSDNVYSSYYMLTLDQNLKANSSQEGAFVNLFASHFWTHSATMDQLSVQTIYLRQNGCIQSDKTQYELHKKGLHINSDGGIDANNDAYFGGTVTIEAELKVNGKNGSYMKNLSIEGVCNVDKLHFNKTYSSSDTGFSDGDVWLANL